MLELIDTHAHIASADFDGDRNEVLARARAVGVVSVIAVAEGLVDSRRSLELAGGHPLLRAAAGVHPDRPVETAAEDFLSEVEAVCELVRRNRERLFAIGEVGLDYWRAKQEPERALQREVLRRFSQLSREVELPLSVHSRSAGRHVIDLLLEARPHAVVLHAFDGKAASALPGVSAGFFFSIPPSITRSKQKQKLVRRLPLECLLLETDSPVLGPNREERNEPSNVRIAAEEVASFTTSTLEEVARVTTANARRVFRL
ncbi:TatD family hydrolase [Planctomycetota bacterium]